MRWTHLIFLTLFLAGCGFFVDEEVEAAVKTGNPAECTKFEELRRTDSCFSKMAENKDSTDLCKRITRESRQANCVINIAENKADINICQEVKGYQPKHDCYNRVAQKTKNIVHCKLINHVPTISKCIENIAYDTDNWRLCNDLSVDTNSCFNRIAQKLGVDICTEMKNPMSADWCVRKNARTTQQCDDFLIQDDNREGCYKDLAYRTNDVDICPKMERKAVEDNCYDRIASTTRDWKICTRLSIPERQDICIGLIAIKLRSAELCSHIKIPWRVQRCLEKTA